MYRITTWSCVLVVLVLLGGCRTYGGYGSEEAIYRQIERIVERFEEDLSRARGDLAALERASSQDPVLESLSDHYTRLIEAHEAVLEAHRQTAAELSPGSTYRSLHRTYGAMITQQALLRQQYRDLLRDVYDGFSGDTTRTVEHERPYALIPPYYVRMANAEQELTMNQVIARVQTGVPRPGFALMPPERREEEGADAQDEPAGH